jgi:hypothetical protein
MKARTATVAAVLVVLGLAASAAAGQGKRFTGSFVGDPAATVELTLRGDRAYFVETNVNLQCADDVQRRFSITAPLTARVRNNGHFQGFEDSVSPTTGSQLFFFFRGKIAAKTATGDLWAFVHDGAEGGLPDCYTVGRARWTAHR